MPFRIRGIRNPRTATVVFTARDDEVASMNVRIGPCVERVGPRGGRVRPIVSPWDQYSDRVDHLETLFEILVPGDRVDLVAGRVEQPPGALLTLSPDFAAALRDMDPSDAGHERIQRAWLAAVDWPKGMQLGGLTMRLMEYNAKARTALHFGHGLYCWSGPELPFLGIASGHTQQDYEEYRRATSRR
jgi:hypothetical protein